jgi:hypothetical protein
MRDAEIRDPLIQYEIVLADSRSGQNSFCSLALDLFPSFTPGQAMNSFWDSIGDQCWRSIRLWGVLVLSERAATFLAPQPRVPVSIVEFLPTSVRHINLRRGEKAIAYRNNVTVHLRDSA